MTARIPCARIAGRRNRFALLSPVNDDRRTAATSALPSRGIGMFRARERGAMRMPQAGFPGDPATISADGVELQLTRSLHPRARFFAAIVHASSGDACRSVHQRVASALGDAGASTVTIELLTFDEQAADRIDGRFRFDMDLLCVRLVRAIEALRREAMVTRLPLGLVGCGTGSAAALAASASESSPVRAIVSVSGRPDLVLERVHEVRARVLLLVGARDGTLLALNQAAELRMGAQCTLELVPDAKGIPSAPRTLDSVAMRSVQFLQHHLTS